ncbi:MAG: M20/M25/M40 family metallo-hydrolase [Phycisphaerales bacterium]|nr:M20/M25/M40 family metallo-hydrolase [Phycisphaerales bacterium]
MTLLTLAGTCLTLAGCTSHGEVSLQLKVNKDPTPFAVIDGQEVDVPDIKMGKRSSIRKIIAEGKDNSHVMETLAVLTQTHGPRLTGSTNLKNAQHWVRDQFESMGLENARLHQWGVIETRFDRGDSTGKVFLDNNDPDKDNKEIREMEFSTLAWTRGTNGPTSGGVLHLPTTMEEYEAHRGQYANSWVLLKPNYSGKGSGLRSVGFQMRQRNDARHEIREGLERTAQPVAQSTQTPVDANAWNGTFDYRGTPVAAVLTFDESASPVTGDLSIAGFSEGPISEFTREGDTINFKWKHSMGSSMITLNFDGEEATGVSKSSSGNEFKLAFAKGAAPSTDNSESDTPESVLAAVIAENPNGFLSSSMDERVWTTSANKWRSRRIADYPKDIEINIRQSDYDFLSTRAAEGIDILVEFNLPHTLTAGPIPVYNVIAEIRGTEKPEEVVIISGHIDSWDGPGSLGTTDNATGSAVTIEAARILMASGIKPMRTIRFALWSGEEQGILGSKGYVESLSKDQQANISATFVDDGGTNYQGGIPAADFMVDYLAAATAPTNGQFYSEIDGEFLNVNIRPTGDKINTHSGSDHASFNKKGMPGFFWDEVGRADYQHTWHTQNDTYEFAIEEYLIQSATNAAILAYNLANAPEMLPRSAASDKDESEN